MKSSHPLALAAIFLCSAGLHAAAITWDTTTGDEVVVGGDGDWNTTTSNWTTNDGLTNIAWDNTANAGDIALFSDGTGRVTITENINLAGITTTTTNSSSIGGRPSMSYVLQGEGDLVFGAQQGVIDTLASGLLGFQINNRLIGTGGLLVNAADAPQSGQGWIYLSGDNSGLSGGITVQNGMIGVVEPNSLGSNAIALQGNAGLLGPNNSAGPATSATEPPSTILSLDNSIAVSGADNLLRVWGGRTMELTGAITGSGGLIKADTGTLILANNNTGFSGDLLITSTGITRATADDAFGTGTVELNLASGGITRIELSGSSIGNNIILDSAAQTGFRGALIAIDDTVSTVNGDITVLRNTGNGGHLAADGDSTLVLNGTLDVGGEQTNINQRIGTVVYAGGGSTEFTFIVAEGTARLGADNGISTAARLHMAGSGDATFDLDQYDQTFTHLAHTATNATRTLTFTGAGTLTIQADGNTELGPGGALTGTPGMTTDMSGMDGFVWDGAAHIFRVGLRSGTGNSGGGVGAATTLLADTNTITASALAVGDIQANNHGGNSLLRLGETNTLNANTINVGASNRSNATLNFRDGLTNPSVTIRGTDGTSAVNTWDVGRVANFNTNTWTATVDFSAGEVDALVNTMRIAIANPGTSSTRQGIQNSSFSMGRGVLEATTLIVGELSGNAGSSAGTYAANGIFTLDHADGVVKAGDLVLANNIGTVSGGTRNVTGTFNLNNGTLEAGTISRGAQDGTATNVSANFNFSGGTVRNLANSDLVISSVPVNLDGSGTRVFEATSGRSITVASDAVIDGAGGFTKTGDGVMTIASNSTHLGPTVVSAGTLLVTGALSDSNVNVDAFATFGGTGTIGGDLDFDAASFLQIADLNAPLTVGGTVTFGAGFGIANLLGLDWNSLDLDTPYTILSSGQTFTASDIGNFGIASAASVGGGRFAYFEDGSLQVVVIPEPGSSLLGALGALLLLRRRRPIR